MRVQARLTTGETPRFEVPVPGVEQAVVLKALAWHSRLATKDVADLCTLLSIIPPTRPSTSRAGADKMDARPVRRDPATASPSCRTPRGTELHIRISPVEGIAEIAALPGDFEQIVRRDRERPGLRPEIFRRSSRLGEALMDEFAG